MNKYYMILNLALMVITSQAGVTREHIKNEILNCYTMRAETDDLRRLYEFKQKFLRAGNEFGITIEDMVCSTIVITKDIEPNKEKWALTYTKLKDRSTLKILLYTLSIYGDTSAIGAMKKLLHGVNGEKRYAEFAASTLFNSPTPWYPIAKFIINNGNGSLRYKTYKTYLKRFVYEKMESQKQKDSMANVVADGILSETEDPDILWAADQLLITIEGHKYQYSKERFYTLNRQLKSLKMQQNMKEKKYMIFALQKNLPKIIEEMNESDSLSTNLKYRKLFKIEENLDTVKLDWDIIE